MTDRCPEYVDQLPDETLRFYFATEQGRDAYAATPDRNVAILDVGGPGDVPDWASDAPYWVRALTASVAQS